MSTEIPEEKLEVIREALFQGRKIQAIKLYRKCVESAGLAEAKDAIEKLEAELRQKNPEKFSAAPRAGCFGALAVVCATVLVVWLIRR